ncbi:BglG family transcription antiterminator [Clostridioides difficile]|uniref:BglG family transcription antiterminator n=1 Tax=Clostridioides difficile TaxID=1496 RepID=UPI00093DA952|nr:BglG family transcription antiterminator [Clostridioides difficile]
MSLSITARQINIIKILLNTKDTISGLALSQEIGCSSKTIQNEIKDINKQLRNGKILSIRGVGYKLEGSFDEVNLNSNLYDDVDRVEYIIRKILTLSNEEKNTIKLEDLADSMYVSVSTVKNDLKEVKRMLEKYSISVKSKHKQGICVLESEDKILNCIVDLSNKRDNQLSLNDFLNDDIKEKKLLIKKLLLDILNENGLVLTDIEFKSVLNNILVMLSRHKYNEKEFIENYIENYRRKRSSILENEQNKEIIINSIKTFCKNLKLATSIDISNDKVFEEFLYKHISSLCKKIKLGINQSPIMAQDIKIKYPFAFELANIAKKTIEKDLKIEINEDEVANIALHIGGAVERASYNNKDKVFKTIIVCTSGIGTSMLIKAKLENIFKEKLEIDFVISTVPIEVGDVPVINISPILSEKEIRLIEKYIETGNIYLDLDIKSLFDSELFFTDLVFKRKEEVIDFMASKLVQKGYIDEDMKKSYFEREKIATTEIGNMVTIPHGAIGKIFDNKIAIGILKKPISWEISDVRLIIMLALDKDKILDYEVIFSKIYKRVDSIAKVISICENISFEKFVNLFN